MTDSPAFPAIFLGMVFAGLLLVALRYGGLRAGMPIWVRGILFVLAAAALIGVAFTGARWYRARLAEAQAEADGR
ncbi:MAG: hypothetical protein HUU15_09980 [Candidatus Brocadiae bacterium]|nr:hypothetical protein [Candidatus Brocadiia bacterium]